MEEGTIVKVIRDFLTTTEGELCINAGEYLQVLERIDRHWLKCRTDSREGAIPSANITEANIGKLKEGAKVFVATTDFQGEHEDDLVLKRGTLVIGQEKIDDSWWKGNTIDGFVGVFPPSYCWELDASNYIKTITKSKNIVEKFAQVLHSMRAQLPEEIDLEEGDVVKIVEIIDKDWYRGEAKGRMGTFPSSFVRIIDAFPGTIPSSTANVAPYLDASKHKTNEYMNTKQAFQGLEEGLKSMGQHAMLSNVIDKIPPCFKNDPTLPKEIFEDSYFLQNLPASYGSVSMTPPIDDKTYDVEQSVFGGETERCSQGFQDLSRNLGTFHHRYQNGSSRCKSLDYSKLHDGLTVFTSPQSGLSQEKDIGTIQSLDSYSRLSENLSVFNNNFNGENKSDSKTSALDYSRLSENLKVFQSSIDTDSSPFSRFRDQNKTIEEQSSVLGKFSKNTFEGSVLRRSGSTETLGYTGDNVDVRPYALTKYNFVAEFENEIGFSAGEMIFLNRHIDKDWSEGEIDNQKGIFPLSYVNVIVDCNNFSQGVGDTDLNVTKDKTGGPLTTDTFEFDTTYENLVQNTYHKVLYNFHAQVDGDITVAEGEVVHIKEKQNEDWVVVENSEGDCGVMPVNHLDPKAEFDGQAVFDIERLLTYKLKKEQKEALMSMEKLTSGERKRPISDELKFFDPLRSPDGEMIKIEQELENKVKTPKIIEMPGNKVTLQNTVVRSRPESTSTNKWKFQPKTPKDIESLISTNLSKLRSTSPKGEKVFQAAPYHKEKIPISQMVLFELRGKNPSQATSRTNPFKQLEENGFVSTLDCKDSPKRYVTKSSSAPPRPNKHPQLQLKKKAPAPKPPTTAGSSPAPSSRISNSSQVDEPIYSRVNKCSSSRESLNSTSYSPPPPSHPPPPPRHSKPPLFHSMSLPVQPSDGDLLEDATKNGFVNASQVKAKVHDYTLEEGDEQSSVINLDQTPTNENVLQESLDTFPSLPRRTTLKIGRSFAISKPYVNSSSLTGNSRSLGPPMFPPDKKSPMSPPSGEDPPKIESLPSRSNSVVSSFRSKSVGYATIPDYSPAMSLNHSYETLNMSETNEEPPKLNMVIHQRKPSRPAPPVPVKEQFESSKEKLFNNRDPTRNRYPMNKRNLRHRKIHSLKRQIQIKEKMLEGFILNKEQLLRELDMYQEIAVAKGPMYEHLNRKMDHCQDGIETLSDEIQRLQAFLADEELKLEEESVEETKRRAEDERLRKQLETQRVEEEKRKREHKIKKNKEQRENVIAELVQTEKEYCRDLKLTWQAFALDTPDILESRSIDVGTLFGNLKEIIEVSESFSECLQKDVQNQSSSLDRMVGKCFLKHSEKMKKVYTDYCINNDKAEQLLEKYEQIQEIQKTLQKGVETLQSQVSCFNIGSILIKPVQRILKYPLILNELIKCTEEDHKDRDDLQQAVNIMADVASFINESKRRKDIVDKYKYEGDKTLTRKISKLNMHSINKKSSRISQKFLNTIGIDPMTRDFNFDELEKRFLSLSRSTQLFAVDSQRFRENLHEVSLSQFNIAENIGDLYKDKSHFREVERFRSVHRTIISTYWNQYDEMLESRVVKPLQGLLEAFQGPARLIQKRQDKHLDYSASMQKSEKNKDPMKAKSFLVEMDERKTDYEALNSQLIEELPKLLNISTKIYSKCIIEFILLRGLFVGRVTKDLLGLMDLPLLAGNNGDIMEVFHLKHTNICNQLGRFSFSSKNFKNEEKKKVGGHATVSEKPGDHNLGQHSVVPQTPSVRTFLRAKYAAVKIFQAREMYIPTGQLDIAVNPGDLVGVIQQKDPMGNSDRWFVDNGMSQGFVNRHVLVAIGETCDSQALRKLKGESQNCDRDQSECKQQAANPPLVHPYDKVADDVEESDETGQVLENLADSGNECNATLPTRKAPPVPKTKPDDTSHSLQDSADEIQVAEDVPEDYSDDYVEKSDTTRHEDKQENLKEINSESESSPNSSVEEKKENLVKDTVVTVHAAEEGGGELEPSRRVNHGYEEIPPSEGNSEPSQDLSPIYEEIKGGSRSTVSSNSSSSGSSTSSGSRGKFHFSQYNFEATETTMISLKRGQVVRVIQVTDGEWWYVEDRGGNRGYVPHTYLKLYPTNGGVNTK